MTAWLERFTDCKNVTYSFPANLAVKFNVQVAAQYLFLKSAFFTMPMWVSSPFISKFHIFPKMDVGDGPET